MPAKQPHPAPTPVVRHRAGLDNSQTSRYSDGMKPLSTSIYTFANLIEGGFQYVDKTAGLLGLLEPSFAQYFLSRPRRFGKSLLISTLKAIFQGRSELFAGLHIAGADYDWKLYPVIHLDLGSATARTAEELERLLGYAVDDNARANGVAIQRQGCAARFRELVDTLAERDGRVVILIDEYDKPLLGHLGEPSARDIQRLLKSFYAVVKTTEAQQRFALLTGVSKFAKVSVFSDLNNLTDLTMSRQAATLLGYTQEEVEANFPDYLERLADTLGKSLPDTLDDLRAWYNGYRFHPDAPTVYNPVSLMKCLMDGEFRNYWFETGTPSFLVRLLRDQPVDLGDLTVPETAFAVYDPERLEPLPLLFQTGYLTIAGTEQFGDTRLYRLAYPNREIAQSFDYWLARDFSNLGDQELSSTLRRLVAALEQARLDDLLEQLKVFFAQVPSDITLRHEKYYQTIFYTVFRLVGTAVETETRTNIGRIDAVIKTRTDIFIFEFKLHGSAEEAMRQIREKQYAQPFRDDGRPITLVGAAFSQTDRNLDHWLIEKA